MIMEYSAGLYHYMPGPRPDLAKDNLEVYELAYRVFYGYFGPVYLLQVCKNYD